MCRVQNISVCQWVCLGLILNLGLTLVIYYKVFAGLLNEVELDYCRKIITEKDRAKSLELRKAFDKVSARLRHLGKELDTNHEDIGSPVWKSMKSELMQDVDPLLKQGHKVNKEIDRSLEQKKELQNLYKKLIDINKRLTNKYDEMQVRKRKESLAVNKTEDIELKSEPKSEL